MGDDVGGFSLGVGFDFFGDCLGMFFSVGDVLLVVVVGLCEFLVYVFVCCVEFCFVFFCGGEVVGDFF